MRNTQQLAPLSSFGKDVESGACRVVIHFPVKMVIEKRKRPDARAAGRWAAERRKYDHLSLVRHQLPRFSTQLQELRGSFTGAGREKHIFVGRKHRCAPPAPRPISENYVWRLLFADGWAAAGFTFCLLGVIFGLVGAGLTLGIITAIIGIPFLFLGLAFLGIGGWVLTWRYGEMRKVVNVLRVGEAARGQIVESQENYSVRINGRYPWVIRYQFQANGQNYERKVTTLNPVGENLKAGKTVCVLYLPTAPQWNSIYPHP